MGYTKLKLVKEGVDTMDFELSEEQKAFQNLAYKFALKEFEPIAKEYDREEKYPREIWQKACASGLVGVAIPEEYGGAGAGWVETALITEQLSRVDMGLGLVVVAATFG